MVVNASSADTGFELLLFQQPILVNDSQSAVAVQQERMKSQASSTRQ